MNYVKRARGHRVGGSADVVWSDTVPNGHGSDRIGREFDANQKRITPIPRMKSGKMRPESGKTGVVKAGLGGMVVNLTGVRGSSISEML